MHSALLPTQFGIYLSNLERQRKMERREQRRDMGAHGDENLLADGFLLLGGPANAEAKRHVCEAIFRRQIGDGIVVRAKCSHAHRAQLEEASFKDRVMDDSAERPEVALAFEIRGIFKGEMRRAPPPLWRQKLVNMLNVCLELSNGRRAVLRAFCSLFKAPNPRGRADVLSDEDPVTPQQAASCRDRTRSPPAPPSVD